MIDFELDRLKNDHSRVIVRMVFPDIKIYNKHVRELRRLAADSNASVAVKMGCK